MKNDAKVANNRSNNRGNMRGKQGRKDSKTKRVNFDNERESKFEKDMKNEGWKPTNKCNDIRWYSRNPETLKAAGSIPFSTVTGELLPYNTSVAVPGVYAMTWCPALGPRGLYNDPQSAINLAAQSTYSFTVHANSRNTTYTAADEMMFIVAGAQVYSFLAHGLRLFGTMKTYMQENSYIPRALVTAMGFDYNDILNNLSKMWFDLNNFVDQVSQIWIPNEFPVIERWFWLNSNIYHDASSVKSQFYVFVPKFTYKLSETGSPGGTSLVPTDWNPNKSGGNTWTDYRVVLQNMIDALIASEDRGIIFGDILKAYGKERLYSVQSIPVDFKVEPVYDTEVLTQIENANYFPNVPGKVVQTNDLIVQLGGDVSDTSPTLTNGLFGMDNQILNFHISGQPTPEQIMIATRLKVGKATFNATTTSGVFRAAPVDVGTEYLFQGRMYYYTPTGLSSTAIFSNRSASYTADVMAKWAAFDWAPWIYDVTGITPPAVSPNPTAVTPNGAVGDFDNWTTISNVNLERLHRTAVFSEFGVPTDI